MDPLDRRPGMPSGSEVNRPAQDDVEMEDVGTFRGSGGNRDVAPGRATGSRKRPIELDSNEETPLVRRRINEEGDAVHAGQRKLSKEERSVLSAGGKKGTLDGKQGKTLDEEALKNVYLKTKPGKDKPDLFPFYLKGYSTRNAPALGHQPTDLGQAERSGNKNGSNAAREGRILKSDVYLAEWYRGTHPGVSDDEVSMYVSSYKAGYETAKGTPLEQAERSGKVNGSNAARKGVTLKSDVDLAARYREAHPGVSDDEVSMYVGSYKAGYEAAQETPLEQAERLGNKNGSNAAREGFALRSDMDLAARYRETHPRVSDDEVSMYVSSYKAGYETAKGTPLEQADRLGNKNGPNAARQGIALRSDVDLAAWYREAHPGVSDDEVSMYVNSYKAGYEAAKGTPLEQADRLGTKNGSRAAREGRILKSDVDLAARYRDTHPGVSDEVGQTYARVYKDSYERHGGPVP